MKYLRAGILLAGMILLCTISATAFTDTGGHWAETQINRWTDLSIVKGYNDTFRPNDPITRGEAAVILDRLLQYPVAAQNGFSDLSADAFYAEAVLHLQHAKVYNGYPDGTIRPTAYITRQETVVMLARAFQIPLEEAAALPYRDQAQIAEYARSAVAAFTEAGYLKGTPEQNFCPTNSITRAEFVTILHRMIGQMAPEESEWQSGTILLINEPGVTISDVEVDTILVAPGVGDGTVTLNNVTAKTVYALGGGPNSVVICGNSDIKSIYVARQDGQIRILVTGNANVEVLHVEDGSNGIILTGTFPSVLISSDNAKISMVDATVDVLTISGQNAAITMDKDSKVDTLFITETADGATVDSKGTISSVTVENETATVITPQPTPGGGSSGGSSSGGNPGPEQTIFDVRITILGKGSIFVEEVIEPTPDPEPEPEPDPDLDPDWYGYPMTVIIEGGNGFVLAEIDEETENPQPEPDDSEYILTIEIEGEGTVIVQGGY